MFTVKHRAGDGTETMYSCRQVIWRPKADMPGLYLEGLEDASVLTLPYTAVPRKEECVPVAYIMNANGATVAQYYL